MGLSKGKKEETGVVYYNLLQLTTYVIKSLHPATNRYNPTKVTVQSHEL